MISRITRTGRAQEKTSVPRTQSHRSNVKRQLGERWLAKYDEAETLVKEALQLMTPGGDPEKVVSAAE